MRPYLSNYIQTLSGRRQERVGHLLNEARVGKDRLEDLVKRLNQSAEAGFDTLVLAKDRPDFSIQSSITAQNARGIESRVQELYEISNVISLLMNSHSALLASDIKALEDELTSMEKMVDNFAFLLLDHQAYDYGFMESFTDERGRDTSLGTIPDRTSPNFGPAEEASINPSEGTLTLPRDSMTSYGLSGNLLKGNSTSYIVSDTGLQNVFSKGTSSGWRIIVATAGPVTAPLPESDGRPGAQVVVEFRLDQPAPCSEIKLSPYADTPTELLRVIAYPGEDDSDSHELLASPHRLDRPFTLHFPLRSILRFKLVLNQPTYSRVQRPENVREFRYKEIIREINLQRSGAYGYYNKRAFQVNSAELRIQNAVLGKRHNAVSLPSSDHHSDRGPMNTYRMMMTLRYKQTDGWKTGEGNTSILYRMLSQTNSSVNSILRNRGDFDLTNKTRLMRTRDPIYQIPDPVVDQDQVLESGFNYFYNIGLHYVGAGVTAPGFKGYFVSNPIPSPGDIGEVRLKVREDNYILPSSDRHSPHLTSTEYSVSNTPRPVNESDWVPILPVGTNRIRGERIFIDAERRAYFRFPALASQSIMVYRNGYQMTFPNNNLLKGTLPGSIRGVRMDNLANTEDVITCDYVPAGDPTVVNLKPYGFDLPPLVFAHDDTGSGERFLSTGNRNIVTLSRYPYVNPNSPNPNPVTVVLDSGEAAENLTHYRSNESTPLPPDGYYYIHSGNQLMFNKPIQSPFRVYYQYLRNNVRVRTVLRCNSRDFVSPKVEYVHLKAKTRHPDVRSGDMHG